MPRDPNMEDDDNDDDDDDDDDDEDGSATRGPRDEILSRFCLAIGL